ncbi:bile acid:sodium symporter family protein [Maricaulis parjimensis]|uniref:bile acid:sodium symporter family protein n=1 Tax=Maricaulis parjimensis TaxID=144023 RepID=UPI001939F079|nr:bile acid:sodium symporter [Maricaulis parjimensis]
MTPEEIDSLRVIVDDQTRLAMAVILVGMMFTVALGLRVSDFSNVRNAPGRVLGGVLTQILGLPILTLGLILLLQPPASIALGMIVVACCPGGNVSNLLTMFSRGNTAYSVSLTAISSVISAVLTPVSIFVWCSVYGPTASLIDRLDVQPGPFITQTVGLLAIPLVAGMLVAARFPGPAARIRQVLMPLAMIGIAVLIVVGAATNWTIIVLSGAIIIPLTVIHNAAAFGLGNLSGRLMRLDGPHRRSLTFEVGIQNSGLGLLILLSQFEGLGGAAAITGMWSLWHLIAGSALVGLFRLLDWRTVKSS